MFATQVNAMAIPWRFVLLRVVAFAFLRRNMI